MSHCIPHSTPTIGINLSGGLATLATGRERETGAYVETGVSLRLFPLPFACGPGNYTLLNWGGTPSFLDNFVITTGVHGFFQDSGRLSLVGLRPYLRASLSGFTVGAGPILGVQTESGRAIQGINVHGGFSLPVAFGRNSHLGSYIDILMGGLDFYTNPDTGRGARNFSGSVFNAIAAAALAVGALIYFEANGDTEP